jgi:amino acid transporter
MRRAGSLLGTARNLPEGLGYSVKRRLLGPPLINEQLAEERLSNPLALGVLSCDGISSAAYGTEEILIELVQYLGYAAAFSIVLPMTAVVLVGIALVVLLYREVVSVYTRAGGSYVVARENFGPRVARRVSRVPGAAATIIPFDVRHKVETIHARRVRAAALREPDPPAGADPIGSLHQRGRATVQGRLHAAEVRPGRHDSNVLACEVADSTGELTAVFYGRTQIAGLEPGRRIRLRGMVGIGADGRPAMINPAYDLLA